jgi:sulfoacetaldehyde acetyltransferase
MGRRERIKLISDNRCFVAGELDSPSFAGIAKSMGAEGIVVDQLDQVGPALKKAINMQMKEGKTCVVEITCTRELGDPFRRDALSKPVRFLDKYKVLRLIVILSKKKSGLAGLFLTLN